MNNIYLVSPSGLNVFQNRVQRYKNILEYANFCPSVSTFGNENRYKDTMNIPLFPNFFAKFLKKMRFREIFAIGTKY